MDDNMKRTIEALKSNPAAVQALFRSQDGQKLMQMLTAGDGGAALNRAARSAAGGNMEEMTQILNRLMASPEGAALAQRISKAAQKP